MATITFYIFLLCIGASFIQRTTGFGFGIFIMTSLPFLMPSYGEATTLSGLLALTTSLIITFKARKKITWHRIIPILITFLIVSAIAIGWLTKIHDMMLMVVLGTVLIIVAIYFAFFSRRIHLCPSVPTQISMGALSGLMGGFFGMQGPPAVLYFISSEPDKEHYMADIQCYFLLGNMFMTIVRSYHGYLTQAVGSGYLYGLGGVAIGTMLGAYVFKRIPNRIFQYVVYSYIAISGIIILITAVDS